jgi:hypothetical protein
LHHHCLHRDARLHVCLKVHQAAPAGPERALEVTQLELPSVACQLGAQLGVGSLFT